MFIGRLLPRCAQKEVPHCLIVLVDRVKLAKTIIGFTPSIFFSRLACLAVAPKFILPTFVPKRIESNSADPMINPNLYKTMMKTCRKQFFILLVFLVAAAPSWAQYRLSGTIHGFADETLMLNRFQGDRQLLVDSLKTDALGSFDFELPDALLPGMLLLRTAHGQSIKLLYNYENIRFVSGGFGDEDVVEFIESPENELWYDYIFLRNFTEYQQELLKPLLVQYPRDTDFYTQLTDEFNRLQRVFFEETEALISEKPHSLVARYIRADRKPAIDLDMSFAEQREALKRDFFDGTDFEDEALLRSDILSPKFIDFLGMHQQQGMNMTETQLSFMQAVDRILLESSVNADMYSFAVQFLVEGFSQMGLSLVTDYISSLPHLNPGCMEPETIEKLEKAITPYRKTVAGARAPNIQHADIEGHAFELDKLSSRRTLLVFWSTTCPYCIELLPQLKEYMRKNPGTELVSMVLSDDREALDALIRSKQLDWTHIQLSGGWDHSVVDDYLIYATPTMFLLDEEKNILLKPVNFAELNHFDP